MTKLVFVLIHQKIFYVFEYFRNNDFENVIYDFLHNSHPKVICHTYNVSYLQKSQK